MKNQNTNHDAHYCVYEHVNKENGRRYIGMTGIVPEKRWGYGGAGYCGQPFGRIIKEVGWNNFEHHIIAKGLTREEAEKLEKEMIRKFLTTFPGFGYNVQRGNVKPTEINRVVDIPTRTCGGMHFATKGYTKPADPKAKRGKKIVNTTTGEEYPSIQAAVNAIHADYNQFYRALKKDGNFRGAKWEIRQ